MLVSLFTLSPKLVSVSSASLMTSTSSSVGSVTVLARGWSDLVLEVGEGEGFVVVEVEDSAAA